MNEYMDLATLARFLAAGFFGGVVLIAAYALGLAGLSISAGDRAGPRRLLGSFLAVICFFIVIAVATLGLYGLLAR